MSPEPSSEHLESLVAVACLTCRPQHTRRPRYAGRNPRTFHEKYKELNPERYPSEVQRVLAAGKTPAGTHRPIMVAEVLELPSTRARRCGGGLHARWRWSCESHPRTCAARRAPDRARRRSARVAAHGSTAPRGRLRPGDVRRTPPELRGLPQALAAEGLATVDVILADLGVSSMQMDNPDRGFSYK